MNAIAYTDTLPLAAALWWLIENEPTDSAARNELFFHLRERVRNAKPPRIVVTISGGCLRAVHVSPEIRDAHAELFDHDDHEDEDAEPDTHGLIEIF